MILLWFHLSSAARMSAQENSRLTLRVLINQRILAISHRVNRGQVRSLTINRRLLSPGADIQPIGNRSAAGEIVITQWSAGIGPSVGAPIRDKINVGDQLFEFR